MNKKNNMILNFLRAMWPTGNWNYCYLSDQFNYGFVSRQFHKSEYGKLGKINLELKEVFGDSDGAFYYGVMSFPEDYFGEKRMEIIKEFFK